MLSFDMMVHHIQEVEASSAFLSEMTVIKWYRNRRDSVNYVGCCSADDLPKLIPLEDQINQTIDQQFVFELKVRVGDDFPVLQGVERMGYPITQLRHIPGQVWLVIPMSEEKLKDPQLLTKRMQDMLEGIWHLFKNMFRVLKVWTNTLQPPIDIAQTKMFMFEHWAATSDSNKTPVGRLLHGRNTPQGYLVDTNGKIVQVFHTICSLTTGDFAKKLIPFVNGKQSYQATEQKRKQQKLEKFTLDERSWQKFQAIFQDNQELFRSIDEGRTIIELIADRFRQFKNGGISCQVAPIKLQLYGPKFKYQCVQQLIKARLLESELEVTHIANYNEPEIQLSFTHEKITQLMRKYSIKAFPMLVRTYSMDIVKQECWTVQNLIGSLEIPYSQSPSAFAQVKACIKELQKYRLGVNSEAFQFKKVFPYKIARTPFLGIRDLEDYWDGSIKDITPQPGIVQFVFILRKTSAQRNAKLLNMIADTIQWFAGKALLHLISVHGRFPFLTELTMKDNTTLKAYRADPDVNEDLSAIYQSAHYSALLVGPTGELLRIDELYNREQVQRLINTPALCDRGIPLELATKLRSLPTEQLISKVKADLKSLPYTPVVGISFSQEYQQSFDNLLLVRRPIITACILEQDRHILRPLLDYYSLEQWSNQQTVPLTKMPERVNCRYCSLQCQIPFYYFFNSDTYGCVNCTQAEDKQQLQGLLRFRVMESCVLVLGDRYFKHLGLGPYMQPTSEDKCRPCEFSCGGCETQGEESLFYMCVNCKATSKKTVIVLCVECVEVLKHGSDDQKKIITLSARQRKHPQIHEQNHNLLRILFG